MALQGISAHGTIIEIKPAGSSTWTEIAELGDIGGGGFTRTSIPLFTHNRDIDTYAMGILQRQELTFPMFFNKEIASQQLVQDAMLNGDPATNMTNGFRMSSPDGAVLVFSGGVREMGKTFPVDGALASNVVIRPSGEFFLDGVLYGA
jgi:hypothetical protein